MKKEQVLKILKKHYLLVGLTLLAILLLIGLGILRAVGPHLSTPIASIAPRDTLLSAQVASTLELYLEELKPKPVYQAAKEEIMAMDFSKPYRYAAVDSIRQEQTKQEHSAQLNSKQVDRVKSVKAARKDSIALPTRRQEKSSAGRPAARTTTFVKKEGRDTKKNEHMLPRTPPAEDGFYTLKRAEDALEEAAMEKAIADQSTAQQVSTRLTDAGLTDARLGDSRPAEATSAKLVKALIEGDHTLSIGAPLRLRLTGQAQWSGEVFPANTLCYGRLIDGSNGRIHIAIHAMGDTPLSLAVFDQDLKEGIRYQLPQPVSEALKETSNQALNEVFSSLPYGGVAGGIARLGRNLFGKIGKGKQGRIHLADGYQVWVGNPEH
jgi:hypothetical protein